MQGEKLIVSLGDDIVEATFLERKKRFIVYASIGSKMVSAFLSNTGRLDTILRVGTPLLLRPRKTYSKTPFEVLVAYDGLVPVVVDARIPNLVVREALEDHKIRSISTYDQIFSERRVGHHRIDFCLINHSQTYVEVKGCTMKSRSTVMYPDAPTERGREHLKLLTRLQREGLSTMVIFLAMRSDVLSFRANSNVDPEFVELLSKCMRGGTEVVSYACVVVNNKVRLGHNLRLIL